MGYGYKTIKVDEIQHAQAIIVCDRSGCRSTAILDDVQPRIIGNEEARSILTLTKEAQELYLRDLLLLRSDAVKAKLPPKWKRLELHDGSHHTFCGWHCLRLFVQLQERACK